MARLPTVGGDNNTWGTVLNEYLSVAHASDGTLKNLFINVKDYGALGDNSTDDTATIQSALDVAQNRCVLFPQGQYIISSPVVVYDHTRIMGLVPPGDEPSQTGSVIKQKSGANMADGLIVSRRWYNSTGGIDKQIEIENMVIDGNRDNNLSSTASGIVFAVMFGHIHNCRIRNMPSHGILMPSTTRAGADYEASTTAVENRITQCRVYGCGGNGIYVLNPSGAVVYTDGFLEDSIIYDNEGGYEVSVAQGSGWLIQGNHTYGTLQNGIRVLQSNNMRLVDNYLEPIGSNHSSGSTYYGVDVRTNGNGNIIANNSVGLNDSVTSGSYRAIGVASDASGSSALVMNNQIRSDNNSNNAYGLYFDATVQNLRVLETNNDFTNIPTANKLIRVNFPTTRGQTQGGLDVEITLRPSIMAALRTRTPTAGAYNPNLGSSPPSPVLTGDDVAGTVTFGTGTGVPLAGNIIIFTYSANSLFGRVPQVVLTPNNLLTFDLGLYVSANANQFIVGCKNAAAAEQPNTTYSFSYHIIG